MASDERPRLYFGSYHYERRSFPMCRVYVDTLPRLAAQMLNYTAVVVLSTDGKSGWYDNNTGKWDGVFADLSSGLTNLTVPYVDITTRRAMSFEFLPSFFRPHSLYFLFNAEVCATALSFKWFVCLVPFGLVFVVYFALIQHCNVVRSVNLQLPVFLVFALVNFLFANSILNALVSQEVPPFTLLHSNGPKSAPYFVRYRNFKIAYTKLSYSGSRRRHIKAMMDFAYGYHSQAAERAVSRHVTILHDATDVLQLISKDPRYFTVVEKMILDMKPDTELARKLRIFPIEQYTAANFVSYVRSDMTATFRRRITLAFQKLVDMGFAHSTPKHTMYAELKNRLLRHRPEYQPVRLEFQKRFYFHYLLILCGFFLVLIFELGHDLAI